MDRLIFCAGVFFVVLALMGCTPRYGNEYQWKSPDLTKKLSESITKEEKANKSLYGD
jgi:hypothetical protein